MEKNEGENLYIKCDKLKKQNTFVGTKAETLEITMEFLKDKPKDKLVMLMLNLYESLSKTDFKTNYNREICHDVITYFCCRFIIFNEPIQLVQN